MKPTSAKPGKEAVKAALSRLREQTQPKQMGPFGNRIPSFVAAQQQIQARYSKSAVPRLLEKAGIRRKDIEQQRAKGESELKQLFEKEKKAVIKRTRSLSDGILSKVGRWRMPLQTLFDGPPPPPSFNFVVLDTASFIFDRGLDLSVTGKASPWNNTAKVSGMWEHGYGDDTASFIFAWRNPSSNYSVINASTLLAYNGMLTARAWGGVSLTFAWVNVSSYLHIYEWWNNPPTLKEPSEKPPKNVGGYFNMEPDTLAQSSTQYLWDLAEYDIHGVSKVDDLEQRLVIVPPDGVLVFSVDFFVQWFLIDGEVEIDFASEGFQIQCPAVVLGIVG